LVRDLGRPFLFDFSRQIFRVRPLHRGLLALLSALVLDLAQALRRLAVHRLDVPGRRVGGQRAFPKRLHGQEDQQSRRLQAGGDQQDPR